MSGISDQLNVELKQLVTIFPIDHPTYQVANAASEQILFIFVTAEEKHKIKCSNPSGSKNLLWSTDSQNSTVVETLQELTNQHFQTKFKLTAMVRFLVLQLCNKFNITIPESFYALGKNLPPEDDTDDSDESMEEDVTHVSSTTEVASVSTSSNDNSLSVSTTKNNETTQSTSSLRASKRLMKEIEAISKSQYVKDGIYKVELHEDSLFEWDVEIYKVDSESPLHFDLETLKSLNKRASIGLSIKFNDKFPFEPPFVRVTYPLIRGGYVLEGGAICLELLTTDGWSSVYSMESVLLQVMAAFVKGFARIQVGATTSALNYPNALRSFSRLSVMHEQTGWYTPPPNEG